MRIKQVLLAFLFSIMLSALSASAQSFPSTSVLDSFSSDVDPLAGIWSNGVTGTGQCGASSGVATGTSGTDDCYVTATYGADQEVFFTMPNAGSMQQDTTWYMFACLQGTLGSSADGYGVRIRRISTGDDSIQMFKFSGSSLPGTSIGTAHTVEFANGDKVGLRIETGGTLTLYFDDGGAGWSQVDQVTSETTYTCSGTNIGFRAQNSTFQVDDFGGGNVASGGGGNNN